MNDKKLMNLAADNIRILAASMVEKANSGHPGGAMGGADFVNVLFSEFLVYDPENPAWEGRDRFFLDPGHMSPMLYSTLALTGKFTLDELKEFRQWGSPTPGHPERDLMRGIENTSGPLGQGHTFAVGAAIAAKFMKARFEEVMNQTIYAYISDGGVQEEISQGAGRIAGIRTAFAVMESTFLMGSMGTAVGEKMARLVRRAADEGLPVVAFTASGGARMQEGLASLMQMAKVSCALSRLAERGLPYISVITDPTTGGVTASFAMQGDIILAEPHALIGFAGQRVIRDTIKQELPKGFQTAEFALSHGLIDAVVSRSDLRATLAQLLALHYATRVQGEPVAGEERMIVTYDSVKSNLEHGTDTYNKVTYGLLPVDEGLLREDEEDDSLPLSLAETVFGWFGGKTRQLEREADRRRAAADAHAGNISDEKIAACAPTAGAPAAEPAADADAQAAVGVQTSSAWESVQLARNVHRPTSRYYIDRIVDGFIELHGDRGFGDDGAIVAGVGWIGNQAVTVITEEKGCDLKDRIKRNFGCPQPEGYRKSLRLMREAEKFGRPIVCFVDTQGAFCGMEAEERGQGNAIADNLLAMAGMKVPIVSVLLGEGGSGGALALAVANRVAMQEHAVYSVLSPEGFASILWKDRSRAAEAAAVMRMNAYEIFDMDIVDAVLEEGEGSASANPDFAIANVVAYVEESLDELSALPIDELLEQRYERFRKF